MRGVSLGVAMHIYALVNIYYKLPLRRQIINVEGLNLPPLARFLLLVYYSY